MCRNSRVAGLALAALVARTATSRADSLDVTVTTLLAGHAEPRDGRIYTVVPAYESLSLVADLTPPQLDRLRVVASGWGMISLADPGRDGKSATGDLDVAYLDASAFHGIATLRLGRQLVTGGAARVTQLDGGVLDLRTLHGVGLTAYGGAPVTPRFALSRGDALVGGRIYYRHSMESEIGFSAIRVNDVGRAAREDLAIDARVQPHRTIALTGLWLWSIPNARTVEASAAATYTPIGQLQITADYRRVAPDLFLPLNSIFTVFSQETRDEVGGLLYARPIPRLRFYADYHAVNDSAGWGHRGGAKLTAGSAATTVGAEGRILQLPSNGYWQARLFGSQQLPGRFSITLDADAYFLDRAINGQSYSFTGAGTLGWDFAPGWRTVATGIVDVTPFVDRRFEVIAKLIYNHTLRFHEVSK